MGTAQCWQSRQFKNGCAARRRTCGLNAGPREGLAPQVRHFMAANFLGSAQDGHRWNGAQGLDAGGAPNAQADRYRFGFARRLPRPVWGSRSRKKGRVPEERCDNKRQWKDGPFDRERFVRLPRAGTNARQPGPGQRVASRKQAGVATADAMRTRSRSADRQSAASQVFNVKSALVYPAPPSIPRLLIANRRHGRLQICATCLGLTRIAGMICCAIWSISASAAQFRPTTSAEQALARYFEAETATIESKCLADSNSIGTWKSNRGQFHEQLRDMLGLNCSW